MNNYNAPHFQQHFRMKKKSPVPIIYAYITYVKQFN